MSQAQLGPHINALPPRPFVFESIMLKHFSYLHTPTSRNIEKPSEALSSEEEATHQPHGFLLFLGEEMCQRLCKILMLIRQP